MVSKQLSPSNSGANQVFFFDPFPCCCCCCRCFLELLLTFSLSSPFFLAVANFVPIHEFPEISEGVELRIDIDKRNSILLLLGLIGKNVLLKRLLEFVVVWVVNGSGFVFEHGWATVISGTDEGIYAWVAANYALGTLGGDPQKTTGIFELGGASAQITFVSSEPLPPEFLHVLQFGEIKYNLYSHSFLHLGQDLAQESLRELLNPKDLQTSASLLHYGSSRDPCTPEGYSYNVELLKLSNGARDSNKKYQPVSHAFGNFSECRSAALMLLQKEKDKCVYSTCLLGSTFIPKLQGRFIATENFFYTSKFFGLRPATILSDLVLAGEQFCEENWLELKKKYPTLKEEELLRYCFSSAYIVALLHDSLGIPLNDKKIQFANQVEDVPLDWALGAFIMQMTSKENLTEQSGWMAAVFSDESSASLSFLVVSMVLIFTVWSLKRWRKPQVKTIYDLEKGRYITTRMLKS